MEYRILGKTGLKISRMGFGGIPIQKIDAEGTKRVIHKLLDQGVNFIDMKSKVIFLWGRKLFVK